MKYQINGVGLNVHDLGDGEPVLVFLHYWGGSSRTWKEVIGRLETNFRCLAYDHRGWGDSDKPSSGYGIADLADDAGSLIETFRLQSYVLVGHSMGGKVAQLVASRRPAGLAGLLLVAPSPPVPMAVPLEQRLQMIEAYGARQSVEFLIEHVLTATQVSEEHRDMIIQDTLKGAPQAKRAWPEAGMIEDISEFVGSINVPTLVLAGEKDQVERVEILKRELVPRIPGAQLRVISGTGHLSPLEVPDQIAGGIWKFLASLPG